MAEKMKPSGIDWIGDIPNNWETSRIKYHYQISLGKMLQPIQENSTDTLEHYMCSANITWAGVDTSILKQMWFSPAEKKQYRLLDGDLLVSEGGDVAVSCIWRNELDECYLQNAVHRVRQNALSDNRFIYYWLFFLKNYGIVDLVCNKATIAHFTKEKFGELPICIMSIDEQVAIADFLDKECAQIDGIAADLEKQIELLQQYKKSLITEMTTPDDSCDWTKTKIKYIGEIRGRIGFRGYTVEDTVDPGTPGCAVVLGGTNIMKDGTTDYENLTFLSENKYFESPEIMLHGGEILITKVGAGTGENSVYDGRFERATTNPNVMILILKKFVNSQYINYLLLSKPIKEDMKVESTKSGAQPAINQGYVNNIVIYIPTLERQDYIVKYLDAKCAEIDDTIQIKNDQLLLIFQHKKSLIYEYVTGKKRVKEVR